MDSCRRPRYPAQRFAVTQTYITPGVNALIDAIEVKRNVTTQPVLPKQHMTVLVDIKVVDGWVTDQVICH